MGFAKEYKNFVNGRWVESKSGQKYENRNPANNDEVIGVFQKSNAADIDDAINAASDAYKKWRLVPAPHRGEILFKIAGRLEKNKEKTKEKLLTKNFIFNNLNLAIKISFSKGVVDRGRPFRICFAILNFLLESYSI